MGACSSSEVHEMNQVAQAPLDLSQQPEQGSLLLAKEAASNGPVSSGASGEHRGPGLLVGSGMSSRARQHHSQQHKATSSTTAGGSQSKRHHRANTKEKAPNMFDLSGSASPVVNASGSPEAANGTASARVRIARFEGSGRRPSVLVSRVKDEPEEQNKAVEENNAATAPANVAEAVEGTGSRRSPYSHSRKVSLSVAGSGSPVAAALDGRLELPAEAALMKPRHGRSVSLSIVARRPSLSINTGDDGADATQPAEAAEVLSGAGSARPRLGLTHSTSSSDLNKKGKQKDVPLAQQLMQRNLMQEAEYSPAPYDRNTNSPILQARTLGLGLGSAKGAKPEMKRVGSASTKKDSSPGLSPASTPGMLTRGLSKAGGLGGGEESMGARKSEKLWTHYAGRESKHMYKKGLFQLSDDVYEEFLARYRKKLKEINPAVSKSGVAYSEEHVERDLLIDLPHLLPANGGGADKDKPLREDYVKYIYKFLRREMTKSSNTGLGSMRTNSGLGSMRGSNAFSLVNMTPQCDSPEPSGAPTPKLTKWEFMSGWNKAQDELFRAIESIKQPGADEGGPCNLM